MRPRSLFGSNRRKPEQHPGRLERGVPQSYKAGSILESWFLPQGEAVDQRNGVSFVVIIF